MIQGDLHILLVRAKARSPPLYESRFYTHERRALFIPNVSSLEIMSSHFKKIVFEVRFCVCIMRPWLRLAIVFSFRRG